MRAELLGVRMLGEWNGVESKCIEVGPVVAFFFLVVFSLGVGVADEVVE